MSTGGLARLSFSIIMNPAGRPRWTENKYITNEMKKYLLPILVGFAGMFITHVIVLVGFGLDLSFLLYVVAYPIVYAFLAFILTRNNPQWWLSNSICLMLIPFIYWYLLLLNSERPPWTIGLLIYDSSGMFLILPLTFALALFTSFSVFKRKLREKKQLTG